jgi:hypothetical protein
MQKTDWELGFSMGTPLLSLFYNIPTFCISFKTKEMRLNRQNAEKREANWSGRGTAMMDYMETAFEYKRTSKPNTPKGQLTIAKKLALLSAKYPDNNFYQSLVVQSKKKPLSPNQIRCIAKDFNMTLNRGGTFA